MGLLLEYDISIDSSQFLEHIGHRRPRRVTSVMHVLIQTRRALLYLHWIFSQKKKKTYEMLLEENKKKLNSYTHSSRFNKNIQKMCNIFFRYGKIRKFLSLVFCRDERKKWKNASGGWNRMCHWWPIGVIVQLVSNAKKPHWSGTIRKRPAQCDSKHMAKLVSTCFLSSSKMSNFQSPRISSQLHKLARD